MPPTILTTSTSAGGRSKNLGGHSTVLQGLLMEQVLLMGSNSPRISICSGGSATYVVDVILSPGVPSGLFDKNHGKCLIFPSLRLLNVQSP